MITKQRGLTLIELMIAITLSAIITAAIASLFIQSRRSNEQNDIITRMQENGRFAMQFLKEDLLHTDFFGDMNDPSMITNGTLTTLGTNCVNATWYTTLSSITDRIKYDFNVTSANTKYNCIPNDGTYIANGNILMIKRTKGDPIDNTTATADSKIYLRSNAVSGKLYYFDDADHIPSQGGDANDWEYYINIYYVREKEDDPTTPVLYRYYLKSGTSPTMESEPLVENIEYFHVEFGIDGDGDSISNYYTAAPDDTEMDQAVSARIFVLVRAEKSSPSYTNQKVYHLGNGVTIGPKNDGYYRRLYTTTVVLKNPIHQRMIGN